MSKYALTDFLGVFSEDRSNVCVSICDHDEIYLALKSFHNSGETSCSKEAHIILYIIVSVNLSHFSKNNTLSKKIIARFFPNFNDLHQNFKGMPQSFANIIPCFQFDYGIFCSLLECGIFCSQVVSKNSSQLESKNSRQLESLKSRNQLEREKSRINIFLQIFISS